MELCSNVGLKRLEFQRAVRCWAGWVQSEKINKSTLVIVSGTIFRLRRAIWTEQQLQTRGEQTLKRCQGALLPCASCPVLSLTLLS